LCTGGELFDELATNNNLSEETTSVVAQQIISAVCYLHKQNIVHRDLKPESIMIESKKSKIIKLIDFGASTVLSLNKKEKLKEVVGSPYYIAPEVLMGNYDEKCDNWSIGIIIYTMLAGRPPF